jgi:hypothetical protein
MLVLAIFTTLSGPAPLSSYATDDVEDRGEAVAEEYEVKVTVGDATVEVRGAQQGVVAIVDALSKILAGASRTGGTEAGGEVSPAGGRLSRSPGRAVDARTFFAQKDPSTQKEAIAVAAFYLTELAPEDMRSPTIDEAKASEVFRHAKRKLPKVMSQALVDASKTGYLDRVARGEYKLSPVGFNLVEHTLGSNE